MFLKYTQIPFFKMSEPLTYFSSELRNGCGDSAGVTLPSYIFSFFLDKVNRSRS
jgi:hypothetical protein